ncbi:MAG: acyl-CoA dehydrogenase family protein [Desulfobacterium sp.]
MEFGFTKEQKQIADAVREFAQKEVLPQYSKWDREKIFPLELWKKIGNLGLLGMNLSPKDGGLGADCVTQGIASEELAKGDPNLSSAAFAATELCCCMMAHGTDAMKAKFLEPIIAGDMVPAFALTEPHCGTDAAAMLSQAVKKGDHYILNGEKSGITSIMVAGVAVVFAKTDSDKGAKGVSAFVVPTDLPGVSLQSFNDMGGKALVRGSIFMDNVEIPADYLLGNEGEGFKLGMKSFDVSRVYLALLCIGAAEISLKETIAYTKERSSFNKPLAKYEGVSFPIVEHLSIIESVRLLCYKSLWLRDNNKPHTKEAAMVKWMAPKFSVNAIHDCLLLHGHYGFTEDLPLEQRLRDVMAIEIADGTAQVSKMIISREVFGKAYLPYK